MTEGVDEAFAGFDTWSMERRVEALVFAHERAVAAVREAAPALGRAAAAIAVQLASGGRLVYAGAGTSGRLAMQDAAELPPTFDFERTVVLLAGGDRAGSSAREDAEDDEEAAAAAVRAAAVGERDVVVGIAASGRTPYTVAAVRSARAAGARTIGIANNPGTALLDAAEVAVLLDTGPEVIAGSTRMVAGTAQKIALNALSTAPMVELGRVYRNLMVAMRPRNAKLRVRAVDIVGLATGAERGAVAGALEEADWDLRVATVMLLAGRARDAAVRALQDHGGRVREAVRSAGAGVPD